MRVLVCGGRDFADEKAAFSALNALHAVHKFTVVIDGAASGADAIAAKWAIEKQLWNFRFPAKWNEHGRGAGPIRNRLMLEKAKPDMVVALPGGRGTADMISAAQQAGVPVERPLG